MGTGRIGKNGEQDAENGGSCKKAAYMYVWKVSLCPCHTRMYEG